MKRIDVSWRSFPLRDEGPLKASALVGLLLFVAVVFYFAFSLFFALLAFVLAFFSVRSYFVPTLFSLNENGVEIVTLGRRQFFSWNRFARYTAHAEGLFLAPQAQASRFDSFRGQLLRYGVEGKALRVTIEQFVAQQWLRRSS